MGGLSNLRKLGIKNNFLSFTIFAFMYIAIGSLAITYTLINYNNSSTPSVIAKTSQPVNKALLGASTETFVEPVLKEGVNIPDYSAQSVLAVDEKSGKVLYAKNPDVPSLPASTTKIVTALVAMDYYPLDQVLVVGNVGVEGQKMGLESGEKMKVRDLLYGLLVYSANDSAEVLAQNFSGGRGLFIEAMNLKAKEIGLESTHFSNPSGLDGSDHTTTARDLLSATDYAMNIPLFAKIVGTERITVTSVDGTSSYDLKNINQLLGEVEGVVGVKTGWTENARENLVTYIKRGDKNVIIVLLGSQDRFGESKNLIDWIFASYDWREVQRPVLN